MENVSAECLMEGAKFSCRLPNVMNHFLYPQHASVTLFYGNQEKRFVVVFDVAVTVVVMKAGLLFSTFIGVGGIPECFSVAGRSLLALL